ncbi:MAG: hypothetical protein IAG10_12895 [Planctomycetaceae bacterium]|nr:hypothetical protein [Planctomycetaceae bacterium]
MKLPVIFALLTALLWGLYGPVLGLARAAEQSPFKPYLLIGVAYLVLAIVGGAIGMKVTNVPFSFSSAGLTWGLISGSLGALGALTLTLAMFSFPTGMKPRPEIVMPIVFGGAVTVTALTNLFMARGQAGAHGTSPWLWVGILGMAVCIVIVAYNTPHVAPPKKSQAAAPTTPPADKPRT